MYIPILIKEYVSIYMRRTMYAHIRDLARLKYHKEAL
jgi:hypothetical protein